MLESRSPICLLCNQDGRIAGYLGPHIQTEIARIHHQGNYCAPEVIREISNRRPFDATTGVVCHYCLQISSHQYLISFLLFKAENKPNRVLENDSLEPRESFFKCRTEMLIWKHKSKQWRSKVLRALVQSFDGGHLETPFDFKQLTLGAFAILTYFAVSQFRNN